MAECCRSVAGPPGVLPVTEAGTEAQGSERQKQKSCKMVGSSSTGEGWGQNSMGIFSDENGDFFFLI